jgi:hypothetical protein
MLAVRSCEMVRAGSTAPPLLSWDTLPITRQRSEVRDGFFEALILFPLFHSG